MTGLHLAHYRIDAELGRGGMGIVYKATDTKLNRTVALKVLPPSALASEDDRARFFREAQAAAQLHHPNIATVFQIDEAVPLSDEGKVVEGHTEKRPFIAMEFVEGETLADYVKKGPVKLQDAVNIAGQVAEALKAAHAKEIVHRDIKSANVMLTPDGVAKVLDFGLAKTNQSTMLTRMGSTLGTVAYMSPEQARGQEVDGRTDLYALGTMLYEMVAGKLPFAGDYEQAVLYSILNEPPDPLTAIRTGVPMQLEWVVSKLLSKEAEYRYQTAGDLLADLKSLDLTGSGTSRRSMAAVSAVGMPSAASGSKSRLPKWVFAALAGTLVIGLAAGALLFGGGESNAETTRFSVNLEEAISPLTAAWRPDGRSLFYVASDSVSGSTLIREYDLTSGVSRAIDGTDHANSVSVSPDSRWLIFGNRLANNVERVVLAGGQSSTIPNSDVEGNPQGMAAPNGDVYFTVNDWDLGRMTEDGSFDVIASNDTLTARFFGNPLMSPDGKQLYWTAWTGVTATDGTWAILEPGSEPVHVLPEYALLHISPNGYALAIEAGTVFGPTFAVPFDASTGRPNGVPVAIATMAAPAVSPTGHLVYQEFTATEGAGIGEPIHRLNSDGSITRLARAPGVSNEIGGASRRNALVAESRPFGGTLRDLYLIDLDTDTQTRLTRDGTNNNASWSPDDRYIYFDREIGGQPSYLARRRSDASGAIETVLADSLALRSWTVTADGVLLYSALRPETGWDLFALDIDTGESRLISNAPGDQSFADSSPDGRYAVYQTGGFTGGPVVVKPLDGEGEIELAEVGSTPRWSADGYVYFRGRSAGAILRVQVTTDPVFAVAGNVESVYTTQEHAHLGLLPDGTVLVSEPENQSVNWGETRVVLNFLDEIERTVPRSR